MTAMTTPSRPGMELLAPAGTARNFLVALDEGADAVYVGAPGCNARALARDIGWNELGGLIERAHAGGARCYFAMNSLVKEGELPAAVETLARIEALAADGIIVQDLGLAAVAQRFFPGLPLHASTLMSAHSVAGVRQLAELGFVRMVLARELTLAEIEEIGRISGAALEIFVQGAMCFSYSGLCLFSSLHGGKSSLRGRCVQPCRRRYVWESGPAGQGKRGRGGRGPARGAAESGSSGGYLFSMNDLSAIELLPELARAGVVSLKVEGRLRSVEYVRLTTRAYRLALDHLDLAGAAREAMSAEARELLSAAMGRRAGSGYLRAANPAEAVTVQHSGNMGHFLGRVTASPQWGRSEPTVALRLRHGIGLGDRLRLHDDASGERLAFTLKTLWQQEAGSRKMVEAHGARTGPGARGDRRAGAGARRKSGDEARRGPAPAAGTMAGWQPVRLAAAGAEVLVGLPAEAQALLQGRLNACLYQVDVAGAAKDAGVAAVRSAAAPVWDRRRVAAVLRELRPSPPSSPASSSRRPVWWIRVGSVAEALLRFPRSPERILVPLAGDSPGQLARHRGGLSRRRERIVWCLPPIIQQQDCPWYEQAVARLLDEGFRQFQLGHLAQLQFFATQRERALLFGDYTCNVLNAETLSRFRHLGLAGVQLPLDSDRETMRAVLEQGRRSGGWQAGLTVYGRPALFTSRLSSRHFQYHRPFSSPKGEEFFLVKQEGLTRAVPQVPFSLLEELAEIETLGFAYLVLDLRHGEAQQMLADAEERLHGAKRRRLAGNFTSGLV